MRIWDVDPRLLCRQHLLGEHRELHAIWSVITKNRSGYSRHPETVRWRGKLAALYRRHDMQVAEMSRRGYSHMSPLDRRKATGDRMQNEMVDSVRRQIAILRGKGCACKV